MRHLRRRATLVFADDERPLNGRPVVAVTFDDAVESVYEHALPVLARHRMPATIFAPTGYLGTAPRWIPSAARSGGRARVVSPALLAMLDARWVKIGSHTVTAPHHADWSSHARI